MSNQPRRGIRPQTLTERRRLYLLARLVVKRHYATSLTLTIVAKTLASSPRQVQRAYALFGTGTFLDDLVGRRMEAATELLRLPSMRVSDVARRVGYRQPPHFARAFRRRYGVSPSTYRAQLLAATGSAAPQVMAA